MDHLDPAKLVRDLPMAQPIDDDIRFIFEGVTYIVGIEAYDVNRATLPDGRVVLLTDWLETNPPHPLVVELLE